MVLILNIALYARSGVRVLSKAIARTCSFDPGLIIIFFIEYCESLEYMKKTRLVEPTFKPPNLCVSI